jgi:hypothetical protein
MIITGGCGTDPQAPITSLNGNDSDLAATAIPKLKYNAQAADFANDHPEAPGLQLSFNTLHVIFETGATVGEVNAILESISAEIVGGTPGNANTPGVLQIRIPVANHEQMQMVLDSLAADPLVRAAVPELWLTPQYVTEENDGDPSDWTWEPLPSGGNWGLELCQVPQIWNLTEALAKSNRYNKIGILDSDFEFHSDLIVHDFVDEETPTPLANANGPFHGMHVAGIAAGAWDNGRGIDGVSPMAQLVQKRYNGVTSVLEIVEAHPDVRVINISVGVGLIELGLDPSNPLVAGILNSYGLVIATYVELHGEDNLPTLVVAAGNDSKPLSPVEAALSSPYANAAFNHGVGNIIVVENLMQCDLCPGGAVRHASSNIGGHVSAPGTAILSTVPDNDYGLSSGTSMASPFVAGLVNFLYAVEPLLTHDQIKELLTGNGVVLTGQDAQPRVDAWATVMDVDRITGKDDVMRMWLDIDDGTSDGNLRIELEDGGSEFTSEDADQDNGIGDGSIDMSDFRRFRDWLLQIENPIGLALDGGDFHPKKDINGNQINELPDEENIYPRGDFNGDGTLDRDAIHPVPGVGSGNALTDLEVLQLLFNDPHVDASELPFLIDSADIRVSPLNCLLQAEQIVSTIEISDLGLIVGEFTHDETLEHIFTVPVEDGPYTVRIVALGENGETLFSDEQEFEVELGADIFWEPGECLGVDVEITLAEFIEPGTPSPLLVRAGLIQGDGSIAYESGIEITLEVAGGSVADSQGVTDSDGFFTTEVTPFVEFEVMTVLATATAPNNAEETAAAESLPLGTGDVDVILSWRDSLIQVSSKANAKNGTIENEDRYRTQDIAQAVFSQPAQASASDSNNEHSASSSISGFHSTILELVDDRLIGGSMEYTCQASANTAELGFAAGSGASYTTLRFSITSPVAISANGDMEGDAVQTNADGEFSLRNLDSGEYEYFVRFNNGDGTTSAVISEMLILEPGSYAIHVRLFCGALSSRVVDPDGGNPVNQSGAGNGNLTFSFGFTEP